MYIKRDVEVEIELDIEDFVDEVHCSSTEQKVMFFNLLAKKMKNNLIEIGWISEDLKPETKDFLMKLCQEKKE